MAGVLLVLCLEVAGLTQAAFDSESALVAGKVSAALADAGTPIDIEDVMNGAMASSGTSRC